MTDSDARAALSDLHALALTVFGEAAAEPVEGKVAVGCVARNRVLHPRRFGHSYRAVCHARAQFSCWWRFGGEANYQRVMAMARALAQAQALPLPGNVLPVWLECCFVAEGVIGGQLRDRVAGATHYYNPKAMVPRGTVPDWAQDGAGRERQPLAVVGAHRFFVA